MSRRKVAAIVTTAGLVIGGIAAAAPAIATATPAASYPGPALKLIPAQNHLTVYGFPVKKGSKKAVIFIDPGIWLASLGSAFQLDVSRPSYAKPLTLTQIITRPGQAPLARPLPANMLNSWNGLKGMMSVTVRDSAGRLVGTRGFTMCPASYDAERATPDGPDNSPYPQQCGAFDPFPLGEVWGIAKDWAINPVESGFGNTEFTLTLGSTYTVTESISPRYMRWLHVTPRDARASVKITVQEVQIGPPPPPKERTRPGSLPALPAVPELKNPPRSSLPDLMPVPAWNFQIERQNGHDYVSFAGTVSVLGNGPLDVEAFRSGGSATMPAYQYFYRNGKVIGRVRAGTMGFSKNGEWHFQQFAAYRLLNANKKLVVNSGKVGFCIAPTDPIDMLLPAAVWQPEFIGYNGQCGSPTALWVREELPVGWADTYFQFGPGQAFDITSLPNGTYYVETIANPEHVLRETNYGNDVTLRKIIISGTKGHRHIVVPAYFGIDREG